ncbi:DNA repair protein RecO [Microbulbifer hydrolyticus]|uniref:DNA repair protein RecO n=1 Tax=Microbulbifer hydrolyticus TaxID=48074 RepID=A0AA89TKK0_9GAMM|nr:DNA repair protein RecO [Microbulbifer hydrolyticus]MBB5209996.1 DNA repair protein RecO (recombination protein O) [Microbulbifer hydrolyticus]
MQQLPPQPAFILHSRPFRDSSLILELFTPDYGRIACIAKGARRDKQRRQRALQPFSPLLVTLLGRHDLKTLGPLESAGQPMWLKGRAVYAGLYANELLVRLLPEGESLLSVFAGYQELLHALADVSGEHNAELELPLRRFELNLLQSLGSCPELGFSPIVNEPIRSEIAYRLTLEDGFVPVVTGPERSPRVDEFYGEQLLAMAQLLDEQGGSEVPAGEIGGAALSAAKRLSRLLLQPLLGNRPLKSRELFRQVYSSG